MELASEPQILDIISHCHTEFGKIPTRKRWSAVINLEYKFSYQKKLSQLRNCQLFWAPGWPNSLANILSPLQIGHSRGHSPPYFPWVLHDFTGFKRRVLFHSHCPGTATFFCFWSLCGKASFTNFLCLSMGLTSSPRIFTKALELVFRPLLRGHCGISCAGYWRLVYWRHLWIVVETYFYSRKFTQKSLWFCPRDKNQKKKKNRILGICIVVYGHDCGIDRQESSCHCLALSGIFAWKQGTSHTRSSVPYRDIDIHFSGDPVRSFAFPFPWTWQDGGLEAEWGWLWSKNGIFRGESRGIVLVGHYCGPRAKNLTLPLKLTHP